MATGYYFTIADEAIEVREGEHACPHVTLRMKERDYLDLVNGKLSGHHAFMTGKLKITGNMWLALKLPSLFTPPADSPPVMTVQQVIAGMSEVFNRAAAKGIHAVFQIELT